jgi:hypothetical protein
MTSLQRYPATLRISERARHRILSILKATENHNPDVSFIAEITWVSEYRGLDEKPGPIVGARERSEVSATDIQIVDGVELVANLHEAATQYFENRTLDYHEGRFVLI